MDDATILSHIVESLQTVMPGAAQVEDIWKDETLLYTPHILAVLPYLQASGQIGYCGEFYLRTAMGRFFSSKV